MKGEERGEFIEIGEDTERRGNGVDVAGEGEVEVEGCLGGRGQE